MVEGEPPYLGSENQDYAAYLDWSPGVDPGALN